MKTKFNIYYYNIEKQKANKICPEGWVLANSAIETLKIWYINLKGVFFKNSIYQAEKTII